MVNEVKTLSLDSPMDTVASVDDKSSLLASNNEGKQQQQQQQQQQHSPRKVLTAKQGITCIPPWREQKYQEIIDCLAGEATTSTSEYNDYEGTSSSSSTILASFPSSSATVDLWRLRELALSRGGLLCPNVRKRAWPTLLACHEQILLPQQQQLLQRQKQQSEASTSSTTGTEETTPMKAPTAGAAASDIIAAASNISTVVEMSRTDTMALRQSVRHIVWDVEAHLTASQQHRRLQDEQFRLLALEQQQQRKQSQMCDKEETKHVTFAAITTQSGTVTPGDVVDDDEVPLQMDLSPGSIYTEEEGDRKTVLANDCKNKYTSSSILLAQKDFEGNDNTSSLTTNDDDDDRMAVTTVTKIKDECESRFTMTSRAARWRNSTPEERSVLFNVISAVLKMKPPDEEKANNEINDNAIGLSSNTADPADDITVVGTNNSTEQENCDDDKRYQFYNGLQDFTALLMINLESPSLTNLVLGKLAPCHLRDALRGKDHRVVLDTLVGQAVWSLLRLVDVHLYQHLSSQTQTDNGMMALLPSPIFSLHWITCWFSQDLVDVRVASRLLDVLLVSHPSMPVYLSVAVLTTQRGVIFEQEEQSLSLLHSFLKCLPMNDLSSNSGDDGATEDEQADNACDEKIMEQVEELIAIAISYMKRFPPAILSKMIENCSEDAVQALSLTTLFQESPAWSKASTAPTDWSLLKRTQEIRLQLRNKSHSLPLKNYVFSDNCAVDKQEIVQGFLHSYPLAMAASGLGCISRKYRVLPIFLAITCAGLFLLLAISKPSHLENSGKIDSRFSISPMVSQLAKVLPPHKNTSNTTLGFSKEKNFSEKLMAQKQKPPTKPSKIIPQSNTISVFKPMTSQLAEIAPAPLVDIKKSNKSVANNATLGFSKKKNFSEKLMAQKQKLPTKQSKIVPQSNTILGSKPMTPQLGADIPPIPPYKSITNNITLGSSNKDKTIVEKRFSTEQHFPTKPSKIVPQSNAISEFKLMTSQLADIKKNDKSIKNNATLGFSRKKNFSGKLMTQKRKLPTKQSKIVPPLNSMETGQQETESGRALEEKTLHESPTGSSSASGNKKLFFMLNRQFAKFRGALRKLLRFFVFWHR